MQWKEEENHEEVQEEEGKHTTRWIASTNTLYAIARTAEARVSFLEARAYLCSAVHALVYSDQKSAALAKELGYKAAFSRAREALREALEPLPDAANLSLACFSAAGGAESAGKDGMRTAAADAEASLAAAQAILEIDFE